MAERRSERHGPRSRTGTTGLGKLKLFFEASGDRNTKFDTFEANVNEWLADHPNIVISFITNVPIGCGPQTMLAGIAQAATRTSAWLRYTMICGVVSPTMAMVSVTSRLGNGR